MQRVAKCCFYGAGLAVLLATTAVPAQQFEQLAQVCDASLASSAAERIAACTQLIEAQVLAPHDAAMAHMHRAWPYSLQGKYELAILDLDAAAGLDPQSAMILSDRGFARLRMGQTDAAIADYSAALQLNPRTVYALYGRGLAALRNGETAKGNADLAAARNLDSRVDSVFAALGFRP